MKSTQSIPKYSFRWVLLIWLAVFASSIGHAASDSAAAHGSQPGRTFEGIEPLFYLDSQRRPYIEAFHKTDSDEYFICRGTIGDWYRKLLTVDFNKLAARDGLPEVSGSTCALQLIRTHSGKKLPIVAVQMFVSSDAMRNCVLSDNCPQARQVIVYIKQRTLYRTFIISDAKRRVYRQYCLDNQSNVLANTSCWKHFEENSEDKPH
jgi:hypothetical protein